MSVFGSVSIEELDGQDQDGVPNFRAGAGIRVLIPPSKDQYTGVIMQLLRDDHGRRIEAEVITGNSANPEKMTIRRVENVDPGQFADYAAKSEPGIPGVFV